MIILKSDSEIEKMRKAGIVVSKVLSRVREMAGVGVTTRELDEAAESLIKAEGGRPAFKGYEPGFVRCGPFPATLCTSVNSQVVHGMPDDRPLQDGDLLSVDTGAELDGYFGDAAVSLVIGENQRARELAQVTLDALGAGIRMCRPGNRLSDVSHAVQEHVESRGYSVVRRYVGHGIGTSMHEDPPVPNYGEPGKGPQLKPGMCIAIEPMVNEGGFEVSSSMDRWPVETKDGSLSAHFEHTVAITRKGPYILTAPEGLENGLDYLS